MKTISNSILSLLNESKKDDRNVTDKDKLNEFVQNGYFNGRVVDVQLGTSVTRYLIEVAPCHIHYYLKCTRDFIAYFNNNHTRLLQDGKYVCVEVPNMYRGIYGMRDCASALQSVHRTGDELFISIGEGLDGNCIIYDLVSMPHLLVAGQTGSGKSVFLHNVMISLLSQYGSDKVQFVLIDPKRVEFDYYRGLNSVREVINSSDRATEKINDLCDEMNSRYALFAELGVRDIFSYNKRSDEWLPRIVVIIEEMAELALTEKDAIIKDVQRLLFKARACGIHVILSTQRPDSAFMSGKLKSNLQCRVVFSMASKIDSRVALTTYGAEKLKGLGDGIFRSNNGQSNTRFQSPLVTEKEIKAVVSFLKNKERED